MLQNDAILFVVHLSAPYLLTRCLCSFRVNLKKYVVLQAYYKVLHCGSINVQHPTSDLFSSPNSHFINTCRHVSTCCVRLFTVCHVGFSCDKYVTLPYLTFYNTFSSFYSQQVYINIY